MITFTTKSLSSFLTDIKTKLTLMTMEAKGIYVVYWYLVPEHSYFKPCSFHHTPASPLAIKHVTIFLRYMPLIILPQTIVGVFFQQTKKEEVLMH